MGAPPSRPIRTRSRLPRLPGWAPWVPVFAVIGVLLASFVIGYDTGIGEDFTSNSLATILGIALGVPIGLAVADYQGQRALSERRNKVLGLLRGELLTNIVSLAGWGRHSPKELEVMTFSDFLRDDLWVAFSDSGELECIRDPKLLGAIANAYSSTRMAKSIADKVANATSRGMSPPTAFVNNLWVMLEKGVPFALEDTSKAYGLIHLPGDKVSGEPSPGAGASQPQPPGP